MQKDAAIVSLLSIIFIDDIEIPDELRNFLAKDGQGIEGFDFMLRNSKLSKRIPRNVRIQYEILYNSISTQLLDKLSEIKKSILEIESNPKDSVHELIQQLYECNDWFLIFNYVPMENILI